MLVDVVIGGSNSSTNLTRFVITISVSSYAQLEIAVADALGDLLPGVECSDFYFELECLPNAQVPKGLVIMCEETFGFLIDQVGLSKAARGTQRALSREVVLRPALLLVTPSTTHLGEFGRLSYLARLPVAVVAGLDATSFVQDEFVAGLSGRALGLPASESRDVPSVLVLSKTDKFSCDLPLASTLREMWAGITRRFPRVTKGVYRMVARARLTDPRKAQEELCIDIDADDEFGILWPQLAEGTLALEVIDQCRGESQRASLLPAPRIVSASSQSRTHVKLKDIVLSGGQLWGLAEDSSAAMRGSHHDRACEELETNLSRRREEYKQLFADTKSNGAGFTRAASLD